MIIKSTSRKSNSFSQLFSYLHREESFEARSFNMYGRTKQELLREFLENAKYLKNSRGKVYLYHEIISLEKELENSREMLFDLAKKYIQLRAENHLVYAVVHNDTRHPHIHLIISANEIQKDKRKRLTKTHFKEVQKELEEYKNQKYLHLSKTYIYENKQDILKTSRAEQEMKHKRNQTPKKEYLRDKLEKIFLNSTSQKYLENALRNKGFSIYSRASTIGVIFENKKYRLKTLGLDRSYRQTLMNIQRVEKREEKRTQTKKSRANLRETNNHKYQDRNHSR
ncbi:relaxase/mobilization nuclease domain-containing protein [Sulfurimonas sp.]|uniref:relaxase/mobilization nuclease domain-containing protein n=1 Tax=Sulfurimonas sp. TaxID=2022749 RepID=UPI003D0C4282